MNAKSHNHLKPGIRLISESSKKMISYLKADEFFSFVDFIRVE